MLVAYDLKPGRFSHQIYEITISAAGNKKGRLIMVRDSPFRILNSGLLLAV